MKKAQVTYSSSKIIMMAAAILIAALLLIAVMGPATSEANKKGDGNHQDSTCEDGACDEGGECDDGSCSEGGTCSGECGIPIQWTDGNSGTLRYAVIMESDTKHHWEMPDEIYTINITVELANPEMEVEFAIGTGTCPHSGEAVSTTCGKGSIHIRYVSETPLATGEWFAHLAPESVDMTDYVITGELCNEPCGESGTSSGGCGGCP